MKPPRLEESATIAAAPEQAFPWADDPANTGWHMRRRSLVMVTPLEGGARLTVTPEYELPRRGLPRLLGRALAAPYGRWCFGRVRHDAKTAPGDSGKGLDVTRGTRCGRLLAMALLAGACARPAVAATTSGPGVPAGRDVYRVQMEDTQGGTSTVAEARGRV